MLVVASLVVGGAPASAATDPDLCYIVADGGAPGPGPGDDWLVSFDRTSPPATPVFTTIGTGTGTSNIEAADLWPGNDTLYAIDADELGTIDLTTGVYTTLPGATSFGTASGANGDEALTDADGMAFDPFEFFIWAVERNGGADYLFKIDPLTGAFIPDAFGAGVDYVVSTPVQAGSPDLDDIAVSTVTGEIFGVANNGGTTASQFLVTIDPLTGAQTEVGPLGVADIEGLTFSPYGNLYATDGTNELFYDVDPATGAASNVRTIGVGNDYESVTCLTGDVNTVSGTVFIDDDADGTLDPGDDVGEPGVTVELIRDTNGNGVADPGEPVVGTRVTDGNGDYDFEIASIGNFVVRVDPTTTPDGSTPTSPVDLPVVFTDVGQDVVDQDFGLDVDATVGDFVFLDLDGDGVQDSGEPGIAGVSVELFDAGGTSLGTTTTDANGAYSFDVTGGEDYSIVVTPPPGGTFTAQGVGGDDTADSDVDAGGSTGTITPAVGANPQLGDAGILPASIGDFVFSDLDRDGIQDGGEPGIDGVTVELLDSTGTVIDTTTTSGGGAYEFTGLVPGAEYSVRVTPPAGSAFSPQDAGGDDAADSDVDAGGQTATITPSSGPNPDVADAGIDLDPPTAAIGDLVFSDDDGDGVQDAGEDGISGVTVELLDSTGAVIDTTTTGPDGTYLFEGLTPGATYQVRVTPPAGQSFSPQDAGSDDAVDSDVDAAGLTAPIVAVAGTDLDVGDAGIVPAAETASIGDFVFLDLDGDGVQDAGEPGIPNIVVELLDADGDVISTVQTDASGAYGFANLTPGDTYSVRVVAPTGAEFTGQNEGGNDAVDSDVDADGETAAIVPAVGDDPDVGDAGILPATLRGTLFSDLDADGTQDPGEPGIPGVTVTLTNAAGATVTTTTDANGNYEFVGIVPGPGYRVTFDTPATFSPSTGDDSDVGPDGSVTITLASGDNVGESDAGVVPLDQPDLPATGSSSNQLLRLGAVVSLLGVALLTLGRRRFRMR